MLLYDLILYSASLRVFISVCAYELYVCFFMSLYTVFL